jgi:hypothetical protein
MYTLPCEKSLDVNLKVLVIFASIRDAVVTLHYPYRAAILGGGAGGGVGGE